MSAAGAGAAPPDVRDTRGFVSAMTAAIASGTGSVPLPGGVSSDIRVVEYGGERYCLKQALPKLKVEADWRAPVERNHSEAEWLRVAGGIVPGAVPRVLLEDRSAGWFAMEYLPAERYAVWKSQLRDGIVEPAFAAGVGERLAHIHSATAGDDAIARRFANDHIFYPIRVEPYLIATAAAHPDLAARLGDLAVITMHTKRALVHGDVSPKNILCGPDGPVFLDAECAWYGDPAFDLAFVLNHLLLKCVWRPRWQADYLGAFDALAAAYAQRIDWEDAVRVEERTAALLPGLMLGRVDGKSPVEYVTTDADRDLIRGAARVLLRRPARTLAEVRAAWAAALADRR